MSNLSKLLAKGGALTRQGDIAGGRAIFEKAVRDHGGSSEPWINLSAVHGMEGNYAEALRCARKAVELAPKSLQGWVNLGNAAESCGELTLGVEAFQRARGLPGCPPDIALQLGLTLVKIGRTEEAAQPLREYLARDPGHRDATFTLARILAMKGESEAASLAEEYCRRNRGDILALSRLGAVYLELGRSDDAWRLCEQAMLESSGGTDALYFKAGLLTFEGRYAEAQDVYEQLIRIQPGNPQLLTMLANVCQQAGNRYAADASIAYARAALQIDPRSIPALVSLSTSLIIRDTAEARRLMEQAVAIAPNDLSVLVLKGGVLEFEGDKQGAWECVRTALERGSLHTEAVLLAASVAPEIGRMEEAIELLERLINRPGISSVERRMLHFALVKLCDKARKYDQAFDHAVIANRLKNAWHDSNANMREMNRLKFVYSASAINSLPRSNVRSELPVFIVGMPRSGTSLLEQILSCHSKVHARGETTDVRSLAEGIPYYPDGVRNLTQERLDALAGTYVQRLRDMAPSATRVTDKLPGNYIYLGIISQLFPGARVLHCRRDPRDICLSNYFTEFATGHAHSYDLEFLAQVYKTYEELMEHWKAVLSIPILDVQYENLVEDPRAGIERILHFCGLEWEDACLNFHESKRQVVTASYDQVRRALYKSSKARWKNYARQLEPVSRILGLKDDA
jgi:tetratricopeptide (TPR) repeat protein